VGYGPGSTPLKPQPWQANNIVLVSSSYMVANGQRTKIRIQLTDALCSSACSLFVEMMTHQAGVQVVVMGGSPSAPSPMQAASGNRGAVLYDAGSLDDDFSFAQLVNETGNQTLPLVRDPGIFTYWMGFNLRDQIRKDDAEPLQFKYLAADCRLYYTLANVYNMSRLWRDVANANWVDRSLCVPGSTGFAASGNTTISETTLPNAPPIPPSVPIVLPEANWGTNETLIADSGEDSLEDATGLAKRPSGSIVRCDNDVSCSGNNQCLPITVKCSSSTSLTTVKACLPRCKKSTGCSNANTFCKVQTTQLTKLNALGTSLGSNSGLGQNSGLNANAVGICTPTSPNFPGNLQLGCSSN
jgi:hypothetical protein